VRRLTLALAVASLLAGGCGDGATPPADGALFEVRVQADTFTVRAEDDAAIAGLEARLETGQEGVVLGTLAAGDGGFNDPWSWHLVPGTIEVPDVAIEVCDGTPSMVESDLEYWLDTVGTFCPWSARVIRRLD
jgi:hypothetical protein